MTRVVDRAVGDTETSKSLTFAESKPLETLSETLLKLITSLGTLAVEWAWSEVIIRAGWLPHRTIPPELVAEACDVEDADQQLSRFFHDRWPEVEEHLRQSIRATTIDDAAKDAFEECLLAHRAGFYRVAPPLLFPHIERVARDIFLPGAMGANPVGVLTEAIGDLGPSRFTMPGVSGIRLYVKLANHLYKQVRTPDEVIEATLDPVPNRNAVLHGRVTYASEKSSLNMLIMSNFIFDAISRIEGAADKPPLAHSP